MTVTNDKMDGLPVFSPIWEGSHTHDPRAEHRAAICGTQGYRRWKVRSLCAEP
jgi:hypothetical protein